jgi:hypothetical protein
LRSDPRENKNYTPLNNQEQKDIFLDSSKCCLNVIIVVDLLQQPLDKSI